LSSFSPAVQSFQLLKFIFHFSTVICRYIRRRAKEAFSATPEASKAEELMQAARREYEVVKRQAVVFNLYARRQKNVMVSWLFLISYGEV